MDSYDLIEFCVILFTCSFAVPIYIIFLYMIVKYRKLEQFNIPFYGLLFECGLVDLWFVLHQYLLFNNFLVNLIPEMFLWARVPLATMCFYGYFYIRACQGVAVFSISINRFTTLVIPLRHDLIWTRKLTWITILSQHIVAALLLAPALADDCFRDYMQKSNGTYKYTPVLHRCIPRIVGPSTLFVTFLSFILIILYSVMFWKARQNNIAVGHGNQIQNDQNVQRSLATGGAIISLTLVLNTCFLFLARIVQIRYSYIPPSVKVFRMVLDTVLCIINPFVLLLFGSKVRPYYRKCLKQIFCIKEVQSVKIDNQNANPRQQQPPIAENRM